MTVEATYVGGLPVVETITVGVPNALAALARITQSLWDTNAEVSPATKSSSFVVTLTAGAAKIDLTALVGYGGLAIDGTGLRVQAVKFQAPAANGAVITFSQGAANGYNGFGAAFSETLMPGGETQKLTLDGGTDIAAANCEIDLAGTGSTDTLNVVLVLG